MKPTFFPFSDLVTCKLAVQCPSGLVGQLVGVYGGVTPDVDTQLALTVVLDGNPKLVLPGGYATNGVTADFAFLQGAGIWPPVALLAQPTVCGYLPECLKFTGSVAVEVAGANGSAMALTPESGVLVMFRFPAREFA